MKFDREKFIKDKMQEHWDYLQTTNYTVVALFLQGSQNYGTDIYTDKYTSDVDTKAIVVPTLDDIVNNTSPTSYTHIMPDNSHIDIKDIRVMIDMWEKQNISYIELLYTPYMIINPEYESFVRELIEKRDYVGNMHPNQFLRCILGMSGNKVKALEHPYPNLIEKIEKYGYDEKQLLHIVRLNDYTRQFLAGTPICLCYSPKKGTLKFIHRIREHKYTLEEARRIANKYDKNTTALIKDYITQHIPDYVNQDAINLLKEVKANIIRYALVKELSNVNTK